MNDLVSAWLGLETGHNINFGVASVRWGLTLLHFLWQGAIIGLLALVVARLLRNQSASIRYWLNAAALIACPICVAWTFATVEVPETWQASSDQYSQDSRDSIAEPIDISNADTPVDVPYPKLDPPQAMSSVNAASVPLVASAENPATTPVAIEIKTSITSEWMPVVARWIAILYAVGVVCFLIRLAIALWGGHRLRANSRPVSDSALLELIRTQAHRIGLKLVPVVAYCERVAVPTVIGVLRPMILLPATLTTSLTTEELSAILSHELAHIRRYDLWMNLLQRIIESLLFFHPVVWFLSQRLSAEREICCDDLVVSSGHHPMNYAGSLLRMAELCAGVSPQNTISLAATSGGASLLEHRVLRLIQQTPSTRLHLSGKGLFALASMTLLALAAFAPISRWLSENTTEVRGSLGNSDELIMAVPTEPEQHTKETLAFSPAAPNQDVGVSDEVKETPDSSNKSVRYPHCIVDIENLPQRTLIDVIAAFNVTSQESPTGVLEQPVTEMETRDAIVKFAAESHVPEAVRAQLNEILKSGSLPSNVYFRRFTRFDDGKQMRGVWWVRLVVETKDGAVYSVPVRSKSLYARPYTQMERQQNAADGLTLINRVASYFEEPPNIQLLLEIPERPSAKLIGTVETAIKAKDLKAFESVFEWKDVSDSTREFVASEFRMLTGAEIHSIKARSINYRGNLFHWSAWQHFQPNMDVFGFLDIEYTPGRAAERQPSEPDAPDRNMKNDSNADKESTRRADAQPLAKERKTLSLEMGLAGDNFRLINYITKGERTPPVSLNPGPSISGHIEPLGDGTHLVTDIITNPGTLLSAHLANEEIRQRDFRNVSEQEEDSPVAEQPNASIESPPEKTGTQNAPAPETKFSDDQKPPAAEKTANRYRILSADGEPVSNAVVRLIYQKEDFRELIAHSVKHQTTTDADGYFQYPKEFKVPFQIANEQDSGGHSATWITIPANEREPEQTWLLGSSAGVRFPYFEAIAAMMRDPKKASSFSETPAGNDMKSPELPNVFRLPKFETTIRVVNADGSPAAGIQVTPSQIAWARMEGGSKNIFVPDIVRDSLSQTTDADGRVTFATIDRMEFAEVEFRSEQHGLQRTFTNRNTIGPELEHDVVLFPAGKVTGTIKASTAEQKEFLRTNKLLLQTQVMNLGLPAPKGFRIAMEGIAEVTPDEQGRFEIPAMLAGQMFLLDRLPDNSLHRITFKPRQITKSSESSLIEGQVLSAVKIQGIARKRDSKEGVAGIPISIRHGGRQAGLSRELTVYARTDAKGRFEAHVFPGKVGYSSLTTPEGYAQAWNWDLDYDAKQEWLYGQRVVVPDDTSNFELPPLEFVRAKEIRGKLVDADGNPVANTGVYARARANQNGNDFATTDKNGEFSLKSFAEGYFPEAVQVGEQFKLRSVRIISRDPFILQDSQQEPK